MSSRYVYIDETGSFEQNVDTQRPLIVGGFHTDVSPEVLVQEYRCFLRRIRFTENQLEIHMTDIRRREPERIEEINREAVVLLRNLHAHIVYAYWVNDPMPDIPILQDVLGTNRFYHMLRMVLRSVIVFPSIGLLPLTYSTVILTIAQRSVPQADIEGEAVGAILSNKEEGNKITILSQEHQEHLFRGISTLQVPSLKKVDGIVITRPIPREDELFSKRVGLMIADIVCHLLREYHSGTHIEGLEKLISIPIPYSEQWKGVEYELGMVHQSKMVFSQFCDTIISEDASFCTQAKKNHLQYILQVCDEHHPELADLRNYAFEIVQNEQKTKSGVYPKSTFILNHLPFQKGLQELRLRLTQSNHAGKAIESALEGLDPSIMIQEIHDVLRADLQKFVQHGEDYALLGVAYQDNFLFDEAIEVIEDYFLPIATPIAEASQVPWNIYGRCISNLAQSLAMRGAPDDYRRAQELMLQSKRYYTEARDFRQWDCHAGSLAALVGNEELFMETMNNLFHSNDLYEILIGVSRGTIEPFSFATILRGAVHSILPCGDEIRRWFSEEDNWRAIRDLLIPMRNNHPVERIVRYLGELAPTGIFQNIENELRDIGCPPVFSPNSIIQCVSNVATYAAWACRASSLQLEERFQYWATRAYEEMQLLEGVYFSASLLDIYSECGLMFSVWQTLNVESETQFSLPSMQSLLSCFRNEWR